jgi:hypothetical protein
MFLCGLKIREPVLVWYKRKRHCEEIPVKNNHVISEAIPETQMTFPCAWGLRQLYRAYFLYWKSFAMTPFVMVIGNYSRVIAPQNKN